MLTADPVAVGQVATFSVSSTSEGTVYYEVFAAGRTIFSDFTETDTFSFAVTAEMLPKAKVVAYQIDPSNEVVADSNSFAVDFNFSLSVSAEFDPEQVKPGESLELILDAGTGQRTLLGVSVVDESVLALGRSRLHMGEVFDELERKFVEPQVELHDGDEDPGPPLGGFWASVRTPGTLDVLHDAGLEVDVSAGIWIPEGGFLEGDWDVPVSQPPGGAEAAAPQEPRVRQYFPETWLWEPTLLTDDTGKVSLTLTAPDNITGWKLSVVGTFIDSWSDSPGIGFGEADLVAFQEFFVEPSLPYSVVRGEIFKARVDVFNYLDQAQQVRLFLEDSAGFDLRDDREVSVVAPPGSSKPVFFEIQPQQVGTVPFQLEAVGDSASDAVLRQLTVVPEGLPVEYLNNGVIRPGERIPLEQISSAEAILDSRRASLYVSSSPVAQTMSGTSDLLGMPYGCGEQNMIFLAPDMEILKYLREIEELVPEVRAKAEYFINVGYQRQLTFQTEDGGFAAFGGREASLWLTAFVLSTFSGAREVRDIDETVLERAAAMLTSRQLENGAFETDDFLIHKEMDGGLENIYAMAAYATNALAEFAGETVTDPLEKAVDYLISNS
ncbi:MAG: alpha-2-macroglobulin family protein, partial [bacterium]